MIGSKEGPRQELDQNERERLERERLERYKEHIESIQDDELLRQREGHRWAVPDRAPSFYKEGELESQKSASAEVLEQVRNEGKIIEDELEARGLASWPAP
jgi:hypothetical protein